MKNDLNNTPFKLKPLALGMVLVSVFGTAQAKSLTEATTLLETVGDPNESSLLKKWGVKVGGWANAGITYNAASPNNNFNGPVTFGDRSAEFQLNQLNLFVQRAVRVEDHPLYLLGGERLDREFLARLALCATALPVR